MDRVRLERRMGRIGRVLCLSAPFFLVLASACSESPNTSPPEQATEPVTLTIGLPVQTGQDPLHGAVQASRLISREGLTLPNRDGRAQPRLAESWAESPDGLMWQFKLRSNAYFHDSTPVNAVAVKISLERSLATSDIDQYPGLADIVSIEAKNDLELIIRLRARSTFLLDDLGVSILKTGAGVPTIGAGPYETVLTSPNELVMRGFRNYYRGVPQIERIVWKSYPTVRTAWAAMMRGEIDFLYEVPRDAIEFIEPETSVQVFPFLRNYEYAVVFNSSRPPLNHSGVRRALNYAVDRQALVEQALRGRGQMSSGPAWPLHWAYDTTASGYVYDPNRSIALLDGAGLPKISPGRSADIVPSRVHFTCLLPDSFTLWEKMALIVQKDLAQVGVDMRIESLPFSEFNERIASGNFDAVMLEFIVGNSPSRPYGFWHSRSKQNNWGFRNPNVDRALDGIRRASNDTEYRQAFRDFQLQSLDDSPAIFLALSQTVRAVSKRFVVVAPPNSDILPTIADWRPAEGKEARN